MKERKVNLTVYSVSGPSFQPVKDGKPYNKYVGTIVLRQRVFGGALVRRTITIAADTPADVEKKLSAMSGKRDVAIRVSHLDPFIMKGGIYASTTR